MNDHRIRFDAPKIDFSALGVSGQDHDNFPAPNSQARYDWMRSYLIGLLSSQSSESEPTQKREGTFWFDLNDLTIKIFSDNRFRSLSEAIQLSTDSDSEETSINLQQWYDSVKDVIVSLQSEFSWRGTIVSNNVVSLSVPLNLRSGISSNSRPFVYANGLLLDPTTTPLSGTNITVPEGVLKVSDKIFVVVKSIPNNLFNTQNITI